MVKKKRDLNEEPKRQNNDRYTLSVTGVKTSILAQNNIYVYMFGSFECRVNGGR